MTPTTPARRTLRLVTALALSLAACGEPDPTGDDSNGKTEVALGAAEAAAAPVLELAPGEIGPGVTAATYAPAGVVVANTGYALVRGQAMNYTITVNPGETLWVRTTPVNLNGDADVYVYLGTAVAGSSYKGTGYADTVVLKNGATYARNYVAKAYCYSGTCNFYYAISKGDNASFTTTSVYVNQRAFTQTSTAKPCTGKTTVAIGECMCSDASGAMAAVNAGKEIVTRKTVVAQDLYDNTNRASDGAGDRTALMNRLVGTYKFFSCTEVANSTTMLATLKSSLLAGSAVLFRSYSLSSYGHYQLVVGYKTVNGVTSLLVNDPYGAWSGTTYWNPRNGTDAGSMSGLNVWENYDTVRATSASILVCRP